MTTTIFDFYFYIWAIIGIILLIVSILSQSQILAIGGLLCFGFMSIIRVLEKIHKGDVRL